MRRGPAERVKKTPAGKIPVGVVFQWRADQM
jgi:hypothetical protein